MSLGYAAYTAKGRVAAGEVDTIFYPRNPRQGKCGLILCHGSGTNNEFIGDPTQPSSMRLAAALATAGIPCIAGDFGGQAWGNPAEQADIGNAWTVLKGQFPSMRTDKHAILGVSMGGAAASIYTQANPGKVAAMVGLIPLLDLVDFYARNVGGSQSQIASAWGVTAPAALPAAANNAANAAQAASVPLLCGYSSVDQTVYPTYVTSYVAAVNAAGGDATAQVTDSTYGHSDQAIGGMPAATIGEFLLDHGC